MNPLKGKPRGYRVPLRECFESKCDVNAPPWLCWPWRGALHRNLYGKLGASGAGTGTLLAHRVAYELYIGPIPEGLHVRHTCDNPPCCNPDHLRVGTQRDNYDDAVSRGRTKQQRYADKPYCTKDGHIPIADRRWQFRKRDMNGRFNNEPTH